MSMSKQMSMFELLETPVKKSVEGEIKNVEKKNVVAPRKVGYIVPQSYATVVH